MMAHICNKKNQNSAKKKFMVVQTRFKLELEEIQNCSKKFKIIPNKFKIMSKKFKTVPKCFKISTRKFQNLCRKI